MAWITFHNEKFNHSFLITVTPKSIEREIRAWAKMGYKLNGYKYIG